MEVRCTSIEEFREQIDGIDREIVALLARRGAFVAQAAAFKKTTTDVRAPGRVEQVIARCEVSQKRPAPRRMSRRAFTAPCIGRRAQDSLFSASQRLKIAWPLQGSKAALQA